MKITCPHCQFTQDVNQQWIPENPSQVECPECRSVFYFSHEKGVMLERPQLPSPRQTCPACGLEQSPGRSCVNCGIVFATHEKKAQKATAEDESTGEFSFETEEEVNFGVDSAPTAKQLPKAGFWIRFVAIFLDGIVYTILLFGLSLVVMALTGGSMMQMMTVTGSGQMGDAQFQAMAAQMSTSFLLINGLNLLLYLVYIIIPTGRSGQTLGKKICGIRVIRAAGERGSIGFGRALLREIIGKWLSGLIFGLGYLMVAFHKQKRALHDLVAGTYVIKWR